MFKVYGNFLVVPQKDSFSKMFQDRINVYNSKETLTRYHADIDWEKVDQIVGIDQNPEEIHLLQITRSELFIKPEDLLGELHNLGYQFCPRALASNPVLDGIRHDFGWARLYSLLENEGTYFDLVARRKEENLSKLGMSLTQTLGSDEEDILLTPDFLLVVKCLNTGW